MMSIINVPFSHASLLARLGERARACRLRRVLTRRELSTRSGVPEATIRRFEKTGQLGTDALLRILFALGLADQIEGLLKDEEPTSIEDLMRPPRMRGKRLGAGLPR
jgi:transcriptional regulator with XRE-family HTH domain